MTLSSQAAKLQRALALLLLLHAAQQAACGSTTGDEPFIGWAGET